MADQQGVFDVRWWSIKGKEDIRRPFERRDFAERHARDMGAWGYNIEVRDPDGSLIIREYNEKVKVFFVAVSGYNREFFNERFTDMYGFANCMKRASNCFSTREEAESWKKDVNQEGFHVNEEMVSVGNLPSSFKVL